jgi:hypothetical protein
MTEPNNGSDDDHWPAEDFALLYCVVYCSQANASVNEDAIAQIISKSQNSNMKGNITGLLVFGDRFFMQCLEGPKEQVEILMSRIRRDPHHTNVLVLKEWEDVRERLFPDWAMQRVSSEHIRDVLWKALETAKDIRKIEALRFLLDDLNTGTLSTLTVH